MRLILRPALLLAAGAAAGVLLALVLALAYAGPALALSPDVVRPVVSATLPDADGGAWIIADGILRRASKAIGDEGPSIDLRDAGAGDARLAVVDGFDGSIWIATARNLLMHVDDEATTVLAMTIPASTSALALGLDQSVWIATATGLIRYDRHGDVVTAYPGLASGAVDDLAVDSLRDRVIMRSGSTVAVFAVDGLRLEVVASIRIDEASIASMHVDPVDGHVWLSTPFAELEITDIDESPRVERHPPLVDPWIPFRLLPSIGPAFDPRSADGSIRLKVGAVCNDRPCDPGDDYLESIQLFATVDDRPVPVASRFDAIERAVEVAGAFSGMPGLVALIALDRFGHASELFRTSAVDPGQPSDRLKANQAPTVAMTAPANNSTFATGSNIVLAATSSDSDGTVAHVDFYRGTTLIGSATKSPYTLTWSSVPAGTYALTAKAFDDKNASKTSATVNIVVKTPPNVAPTLTSLSPASNAVVNGPAVTLSAVAADSDGVVVKVEFYEGTQLLATVPGTSASLAARWTYSGIAAGAHTIKVTATDNAGASTSATLSFTVNAAPWVVLTSPLPCAALISPVDVTLSADALDTDGSVARVDFYAGALLLGSAATAPYRFVWTKASSGTSSLTAVAIDNLGASRRSNPVSVTVQAPDVPPTATLTAPVNGARFGVGTTVKLVAAATDADGTVKRVDFLVAGLVVGSASVPPYTFDWNPPGSGSFVLGVKATDDRGVATTSAPATVSIVSNAPPTVSLAMPDGGPVFPGPVNTLILQATASDTDGVVSKVEFFQGSEWSSPPNILIGTATSAPFTMPFTLSSSSGVVLLMARATDDLGGHADSTFVRVWINHAPIVSIVAPTPGLMVLPGAKIPLILQTGDYEGNNTYGEVFAYADGHLAWQYQTYLVGGNGEYTLAGPGPRTFPPGSDVGIYASVTDSIGAKATSAPVFIKIAPLPTVQLLTPACNAIYITPTTIQLTASASQPLGKIVEVDYYAYGVWLGSATAPPYALTWTPEFTPESPSTPIRVKAIDNLGTGGAGIAECDIVVDIMKLDITEPLADAELYGPELTVRGTYEVETPSQILVNDVPAILVNGTFSARIPMTQTIRAVATTGRGTTFREIDIHGHPPEVVLTRPGIGAAFDWTHQPIRIDASVDGFAANLDRVEFWNRDVRIGISTLSPFSIDWMPGYAGTAEIRATAIGVDGVTATSEPVWIVFGGPPSILLGVPSPHLMTTADSLRMYIAARTVDAFVTGIELLLDGDSIASMALDATSPEVDWNVVVPALPAGTYDFRGRFKDTLDRVFMSDVLHVEVADGPSVKLIAPVDDSRFKSPAQIQLTATAETKRTDGLRVDFLANGALIGSATQFPFAVAWTNVPDGTYQVVARVSDLSGQSEISTPSTISVGSVALNVTSHSNGQTVYDAAIAVAGTVSGNAANTTVFVNGIRATVGDGIYAATIPLVEGPNAIQVAATVAGTASSRSLELWRRDPSIAFQNIRDGMTVDDDTIVVRGTLSAPPNSGLLVGGRVADVAPDGSFRVDDVPVAAGTNPMPVKLIRQDGSVVDWTLGAITRGQTQGFVASLRPSIGAGLPFVTVLTVDKRSTADYSELQFLQGERRLFVQDLDSTESTAMYSLTFARYGESVFTIRLLDRNGGVIFNREVAVWISPPEESADRIRNLFSSFSNALLAGDVAGAASTFDPAQQDFYRKAFANLAADDRVRLVDEIQGVGPMLHGQDQGQITLRSQSQDGTSGFPLNALRDANGIWRLTGL